MFTEQAIQRFWSRVRKSDGCWEFEGAKMRGYGVVVIEQRRYKTHHVAVILDGRAIPPSHVVMHLCDNRACVRPDHLRVGTQSENIKDMWAKGRRTWPQKTHCRYGHAMTADNTVVARNATHSYRMCRTCRNARALNAYHRKSKES